MKKLILLALIMFQGAMFSQSPESPEFKLMYVGMKSGMGSGGKDIQTGIVTTDGRQVIITSGGGMGIELMLGYIYNNKFDISIGYLDQSSTLEPVLSNADGMFDRQGGFLRVKYKQNLYSRLYANAGIGGLYLGKNVLDIDASQIQGGGHNIYTYSKEFAPLFALDLEWFNKKYRWSFDLGIEYYPVEFKLESMTSNGYAIDPQYFTSDPFFAQTKTLDGSTLNINVGFAFHFGSK